MTKNTFTHQQLLDTAKFNQDDLEQIRKRRQDHSRLGFGYQLAFVRLTNRLPDLYPLEHIDELLNFVSMQLAIPVERIEHYGRRRQTVDEHRSLILDHLNLRRFGEDAVTLLEKYLFAEACRLEQTGPLLNNAKRHLREQGILHPADSTLIRLIKTQREKARQHIYERLSFSLTSELLANLDALLVAEGNRLTPFHSLKQPPRQASPSAILQLASKLDQIRATGVLSIDLSWLNNNYQRSLTRYARRCSAFRMRELKAERRYAVLVCFLRQLYSHALDQMIDTHDKLMTGVYSRAQSNIDEHMKKERRVLRASLATFQTIGNVILDESIADDQLRETLFQLVNREKLVTQVKVVGDWVHGEYSHVFNVVAKRYPYLRQFAPTLIEQLQLDAQYSDASALVKATQILHSLNEDGKRKLPENAPLGFHTLISSPSY
jgi:hypothetical protein